MAEKSFDTLLRQALLDAAWQELTLAWETESPTFSPAYLHWRTRLLADPFAWAKKHLRPLWARALRTAACILLAASLTLGSLMAVSPTVRAAVLNWLREISGNLMTYTSSQPAKTNSLPSNWRITWLPEGWTLKDMTISGQKYYEPSEKGSLFYTCYTPDSAEHTTNIGDVSDAESVRETLQVQGYSADYYQSGRYQILLWENQDGFLFLLRDDMTLDRETFLKIAESIRYYPTTDTAYELSWVPAEYEPFYRDEMIGAVQEEWTWNQTSLIWRYVTDPLCPFVLPEGEPEEVSLGEFTGQLWIAEEPPIPPEADPFIVNGEPVEESGSSIAIGGVQISVSTDPSQDQTSTLLWTDPDTNTTFLLEGAVVPQDLISMAESLRQTTPSPTPPPRRSMLMAGTAGG